MPFRSSNLSWPTFGMRDDHLRVLLEDRGDDQERQALLRVIDALERVRHDHVDATAEQQLRGILLRPALADVAFDPVLLVDTVGGGEIEAAMLGLRAPVGLVADLVERLRRDARAGDRHERYGAAHEAERLAAVDTIFRHAHDRFPFTDTPLLRGPRPFGFPSNRYAAFQPLKRGPDRLSCPRIQHPDAQVRGRSGASLRKPTRDEPRCVVW